MRRSKLAVWLYAVCASCALPAAQEQVLVLQPLAADANSASEPVVTTSAGLLRGQQSGATRRFLGIPYAQPPLGALRFAAPQPALPWSGVREATQFGPSCMQIEGLAPELSEDCLTLNVFAPARSPSAARPVMVFIHGGAFLAGGSYSYAAERLRETGDVVVVTLNYRLGAFGFLAHPQLCQAAVPCSNQGLRDQQLALRWVAQNIAAFGGDPKNVTLFGESAGAVSTCMHMFTRGSEGLAQRFILESGSCVHGPLAPQSQALARSAGQTLVDTLCPGAPDPLACLRAQPAERIRELTIDTVDAIVDGYWPWLDGDLFEQSPEERMAEATFVSPPVIVGTNTREWALWSALGVTPAPLGNLQLRQYIERFFPASAERVIASYLPANPLDASEAFVRLMTDAYFRCPAYAFARAASARGGATYLYEFAVWPAAHSLEIDYVFDQPAVSWLFPFEAPNPPLPDVVRSMQAHWTQFAVSGDPNRSGLQAWPRYDDRGLGLVFGATPSPQAAPEACALWESSWSASPLTR